MRYLPRAIDRRDFENDPEIRLETGENARNEEDCARFENWIWVDASRRCLFRDDSVALNKINAFIGRLNRFWWISERR